MDNTRTSLDPELPGRSSFRLCRFDPSMRSTKGRRAWAPPPTSLSIATLALLHPERATGRSRRCSGRPRVREAKADVAGRPFCESGCKHRVLPVVVVVNFGRLLAGMGTQDPPDILDEPPLEGDRPSKEQRVQCRAIEALADKVARGHDKQGRTAVGRSEPLHGGSALTSAHPSLEDDGLQAAVGQTCGQMVDMGSPLGQHQAVAAAALGLQDVAEDLVIAHLVSGERSMDAQSIQEHQPASTV